MQALSSTEYDATSGPTAARQRPSQKPVQVFLQCSGQVTVTAAALSLLLSTNDGELLLSDTDPAAEGRVCVAGERPDGLMEGSELASVSGSCCEAVD